MLIDLKELFSKDNNELQYESDIDFDSVETRFGSFKIKQKSPLKLTLFHKHDRQFSVEGNAKLVVDIPCDRCLTDVPTDFTLSFEKQVNTALADGEDDGESDEANYIDGYHLDVEQLLYNEILVGWPMKVLCSEDCKGICSVCGQNLNEGSCDCEDTSLDPRMSVIRDLYKNFKEV